jgi:hypothetical protein
LAWSRTPGDGRSVQKQRKSPAVCEVVEDENVLNGASRLVSLVYENRVFEAHLLGASELRETDWNGGTTLATARWFSGEVETNGKKRGRRE